MDIRNRTGETPWGGGIEVYDEGRYFVMTSDRLEDKPDTVEERQSELDRLLAEWLPEPQPNGGPPAAGRAFARPDSEASRVRSQPRTGGS